MNLLNIFTKKNIQDIFDKISKRIPLFFQVDKPSSSEEVPYEWFHILDTKELEEDLYDIKENVVLDTTEYDKNYEYSIAFLDGTPSMSITNAYDEEEELTNNGDLLIEILEE